MREPIAECVTDEDTEGEPEGAEEIMTTASQQVCIVFIFKEFLFSKRSRVMHITSRFSALRRLIKLPSMTC
jgi:hypothetical protein